MDPKEAETQRKMRVLAGYIEDQLGKGVKPKTLYENIRARNVPHELAVEMIDRAVKTGIALPVEMTVDTYAEEESPAVSPEMPVPPSEREVSPVLPTEPVPAKLPSLFDPKAVEAYIAGQLSIGIEMKPLVDELVGAGMARNEAIDLVLGISEKLKAEVRDQVRSAGGGSRTELRKSARNKMLVGAALFFGGICFTAASWFAADEGGTYWILYGPIIFGAISGIAGLVEWLRK